MVDSSLFELGKQFSQSRQTKKDASGFDGLINESHLEQNPQVYAYFLASELLFVVCFDSR